MKEREIVCSQNTFKKIVIYAYLLYILTNATHLFVASVLERNASKWLDLEAMVRVPVGRMQTRLVSGVKTHLKYSTTLNFNHPMFLKT